MTKPLSIASDELVDTVSRSERSQVQVRRCRLATGFEYVDARVWDRTWGANPYKATKKGFTVAIEHVPALIEALQKAAAR